MLNINRNLLRHSILGHFLKNRSVNVLCASFQQLPTGIKGKIFKGYVMDLKRGITRV